MIVWLKRHGEGLFPYDPDGAEEILQYPQNTPLRAKIVRPRNPSRLALYFQIITRVARGMGVQIEDLDRDIRLAVDHVDVFLTEKYGAVKTARSIKFDAVEDELDFERFFQAALIHIHGTLGIPHEALADLVDGKRGRR